MAISAEQLAEIKKYLLESENPLFFYDADCDGLCSFLLIRRFLNRGEGVVVKGSPKLEVIYSNKVNELHPDKIFVFDKPIITEEFVEKIHVPIIWIDHHTPLKLKGVKYFNPRIENIKDGSPVTYWCYKITKQDLWIATIGSYADWFVPEFSIEFSKQYSDILPEAKAKLQDPGEILFSTTLGNLVKIFSFILKGKTNEIVKCANYLCQIDSPYELLNGTSDMARYILEKARKIEKEYSKLLNAALSEITNEKLFVFVYTGKYAFSQDLSTELIYRYPNKIIIIAREKDGELKISLRSRDIVLPPILEKALEGLEGYGGGHEHACGANIKKHDLDKFIERIKEQIKNQY